MYSPTMLRPGSALRGTELRRSNRRRGVANPFDAFFSDIDALLGQATSPRSTGPKTNAYRTDDAYHLVFEVPGLTADNLELEARDGNLRVKGDVTSTLPEGARLLRKERAAELHFERSYSFADDADLASTTANLKDGLLTLTVPRTQPTTRRIEVKVG